jgi:hypothetical protein
MVNCFFGIMTFLAFMISLHLKVFVFLFALESVFGDKFC